MVSEVCAKRRTGFFMLIPVVLLLYVLSIGPVVAYANWSDFDFDIERFDRIFNTVYYPILQLADYSPVFKSVMDWYLLFWTQSIFGVDCCLLPEWFIPIEKLVS